MWSKMAPTRVSLLLLPYVQVPDRQPLVKDRAEYERMHKWSIDNPEEFWAHMAHDYYWAKKVWGTQPCDALLRDAQGWLGGETQLC